MNSLIFMQGPLLAITKESEEVILPATILLLKFEAIQILYKTHVDSLIEQQATWTLL